MSSTFGPWIVGDDEDSDYSLVGPDEGGGLVCYPVVRVHDEKLAHLFAAAPELLEALQTLLGPLDGLQANLDAAKKARAAIAKATGSAA